MKRRSWLWLIASVILAIMAGVLAIVALNIGISGIGEATPVPLGQEVVVATSSFGAGTRISADLVKVDLRPDPPSGAARRVQDVLGAEARRQIAQNEVILMQDINPEFTSSITGGVNPIVEYLPDDKIAVALPAEDILGKWGAVLPGDHVDVLFTLDIRLETPMTLEDLIEIADEFPAIARDQSFDEVSLLTLQNLEVLKVIEEPRPDVPEGQEEQVSTEIRPRALVLQIDPQDAVVLKYLQDSIGEIDLALRGRGNATLFDVQPVNINYLMLRYGIILPQPLE